MLVPETTFAEAFERYVGGKCLVAWRGSVARNQGVDHRLPRNVEMRWTKTSAGRPCN